MKFNITGRHVDVTNALRDYAEERVQKFQKYSSGPIRADVILSVEKNRHQAELLIRFDGRRILAKEETHEMYQSIDKAAASIERRIRKLKEKRSSHGREHRTGEKTDGSTPVGKDDWDIQLRPARRVSALAMEAAVGKLVSENGSQILFVDESDGKLKILERRAGNRIDVREVVAD